MRGRAKPVSNCVRGGRQYIDGWWNYFELADWRREVENLSGWIRRHVTLQQALKTRTLNGYGFIVPWEFRDSALVTVALCNRRMRKTACSVVWEP